MAPNDVLLRWRLPIARPDEQRRALIALWHKVPIYARHIGGVSGGYGSRHVGEARFTLFAEPECAEALWDGLSTLFGEAEGALAKSSDAEPLLAPDLAWYRARLHQVCGIALSIRSDSDNMSYRLLRVTLQTLPDPATLGPTESVAALYESELKRRLVLLAPVAMDRIGSSADGGTSFWADFVRRPLPTQTSLAPAGHLLWNLVL